MDFRDDGGGAAFPAPEGCRSGMTLREWYAGLAMQALVSRDDFRLFNEAMDTGMNEELLAQNAHVIADAMLAHGRKGVSP